MSDCGVAPAAYSNGQCDDLQANEIELSYLHSDHIGSNSLMTDASGAVVPNSQAAYLPFGDWRDEPSTSDLTDVGYTGHRHNNIGGNDLGLIYMNARYYVPGLARFASADIIIPDATNPQSYNRFSYVYNRPLIMTDPTGHYGCNVGGYLDCSTGQQQQPATEEDINLAVTALSLFPVIGDVIDIYDISVAIFNGNYSEAVFIAILAAAPGSSRVLREGGGAIVGAVTRFIPAGIADETGEVIGAWISDNKLGLWKQYEEFVTGVQGMNFHYNGYDFDGIVGNLNSTGEIADIILLDTKRWSWASYNTLTTNSNALYSNIQKARQQILAANGIQIQWHFHIKEIADWWREVLLEEGITSNQIDVIWTPME